MLKPKSQGDEVSRQKVCEFTWKCSQITKHRQDMGKPSSPRQLPTHQPLNLSSQNSLPGQGQVGGVASICLHSPFFSPVLPDTGQPGRKTEVRKSSAAVNALEHTPHVQCPMSAVINQGSANESGAGARHKPTTRGCPYRLSLLSWSPP